METKEEVTLDGILKQLAFWVREHYPIGPAVWLNAAAKLNILLGNEQDHLFEMEQKVSQLKLDILKGQDKRNVSAAELEVAASKEYLLARKQQAKIDRIIETIRLAKHQSRMVDESMRNQ